MALYLIANGAMPTTAAIPPVTTGVAIKTLLQIKPFNLVKIKEWGISFDGSVAAAGVKCELLDTGTVFGTVTASVDADIMKFGGADPAVASIAGLTLGVNATGYTATVEGAITVAKVFDMQIVQPTNNYVKQFPLGLEPVVLIGNCARIRVTVGAAINAWAYMIVEL